MRFYEDSRTFSLHFLMETRKAYWRNIQRIFCSYSPLRMRSAFGRKNRKLFRVFSVPIFHWSRDAHVVRFSGNFSSSLTWEKCQPPLFHYPLEEKRLFERKKDAVIQIFFSLIYLDRKRLVGRKNLKIEKKQPYHRKGSVIGLLSIEKFTIA